VSDRTHRAKTCHVRLKAAARPAQLHAKSRIFHWFLPEPCFGRECVTACRMGQDKAQEPFVPHLTVRERDRVRYQDPTLSIWLSRLWLSSFQLTTVAGAAVLAKTAVAPLERVKVSKFCRPAPATSSVSAALSPPEWPVRLPGSVMVYWPAPPSCYKVVHWLADLCSLVQIVMQVGPMRGYDPTRGRTAPLQSAWTCLRHMVSKEGWKVCISTSSHVCCQMLNKRTQRGGTTRGKRWQGSACLPVRWPATDSFAGDLAG
jgi:hypothetical protein